MGHIERQYTFGLNRNYIVLILQDALHHEEATGDQEDAVLLNQIGIHDGIGNPGFIFQAEEYETFCGSGSLARDHASADPEAAAARHRLQTGGGMNAECLHFGTTISHRMRPDGHTGAMEVGDQALFVGHLMERGRSIGFWELFQERSGPANCLFHLPQRIATVKLRVASCECRAASEFRVSSFGFRDVSVEFRVNGFLATE